MTTRSERAAAKKNADLYTQRLLAEHAALRAEILALRPTWSREKLEAIQRTYNCLQDATGPGLRDILDAVKAADKMEALFGGG